ncbi:MAG: L,D-transpeptidase, partial [Bacteroidetes bacterium]|nr:L,D-transpeptidase [Bacteroidota bacterium]
MKRIQSPVWRHLYIQFCMVILALFLANCSTATAEKKFSTDRNSLPKDENIVEIITPIPPVVSYHLISTKDSIEWLKSLQMGDTLKALLVLNRIDKNHLLSLDSIVVPDIFGNNIEIYSPFPNKISELQTIHKILLVSYYAQSFGVYENGVLVRWGPTSLGKQSTLTPTGLLSTNWKSKSTISTIDSTWVMDWYFNLENFQGVSMHEYALPGYPASHACVRLYQEDANWLYYWADQWVLDHSKIAVYGTPVVIFDAYPFGQ